MILVKNFKQQIGTVSEKQSSTGSWIISIPSYLNPTAQQHPTDFQ